MLLMNGFECLSMIKKDPKFRDLLVLIYSYSANPDQIEMTFQEGAYLYFQKSNNIIELRNMAKKCIQSLQGPGFLTKQKRIFGNSPIYGANF
jgi:CheY-like chemotaxis protein